jgi:ATP-dependent DNA ligase
VEEGRCIDAVPAKPLIGNYVALGQGRILVFRRADRQRQITANTTEEIKYDGFRALCFLDNGAARLVSRNGNTFGSFHQLAAGVVADFRGDNGVLDGEIVSLDAEGRPQFEDLMFRRGELFFVAFDALWLDGGGSP